MVDFLRFELMSAVGRMRNPCHQPLIQLLQVIKAIGLEVLQPVDGAVVRELKQPGFE